LRSAAKIKNTLRYPTAATNGGFTLKVTNVLQGDKLLAVPLDTMSDQDGYQVTLGEM
jgi:hypothetical protein|tara:strand:+ start:306 stop:476 length:171 start_codon:yes stop_codon:yes gene_type:complete